MSKNKLSIFYFLGFIMALSTAFPAYIISSFLEGFVKMEWIGLFYLGSTVVTFLVVGYYPHLIRKFSNYYSAVGAIVVSFFSIVFLISANNFISAFLAFLFLDAGFNLIWINMDVFLERFTSNKTTGTTRTIYFTAINLGWIVTPLIVGNLVGNNNFRLIYFISALLLLPFLIVILLNKKRLLENVDYQKYSVLEAVKNIIRKKDLYFIFLIAFLLQLFYSMLVLYMPLYLRNEMGLSWPEIGILFTFMLLPFVLFEIPAGKLADKFHLEKTFLAGGFLILIVSSVLFCLVDSSSLIVWGGLLFLSRFGAALIESMRESYFFKLVDVEELSYINLFRNTGPLAYFVGAILSMIILHYLPIQNLFLITGVILIFGVYFSFSLKKIK